jgi:ATP-dependent DNA helicase RecG
MTPKALQRLIASGETLSVEFKGEERSPLNDRDLVEAVVCLANRMGTEPAWLLIGVEDDGRITGARPRHGAGTDIHKLAALIASRTRPALSVHVEAVDLDSRSVLVIQVPPQRQPVGRSDGVFLHRTIGGDGRPACLPMDGYAMQSLQADRGLLDPSAQIVAAAHWQDLDPLEFERFRRSVRERRGRSDESLLDLPDLELAKALGVVEANGAVRGVRLAALLLFGNADALRRFVPSHEAAFQVLRGLEVEVNDFFRWSLLRVMEEIETRNPCHPTLSGGSGARRRTRPEKGPYMAPFRRRIPGVGRQGRLRAPARLRATAAGTDGVAVRGKARPDHATGGGGVVSDRPVSGDPPAQSPRQGRSSAAPRRTKRGMV